MRCKKNAVEYVLVDMFLTPESSICISTIRQLAEMMEITLTEEQETILRWFHCKKWNTMKQELRNELALDIAEIFGFELEALQVLEAVEVAE